MIIYRPKGRAQEYSYLAINHYAGCGHGCTYCYVPAVLHVPASQFNKPRVRKNVLELLAAEAPKFEGTDERVLLCFTCDPYQLLDISEGLTRKVIEILKLYEIPFQVLTKGGMRAARDFDLYEQGDAFATTMTFLSDDKSRPFEPHAAPPALRIRAIEAAKKQGIETWVSLEPVLCAKESLKIIHRLHNIVDHFKLGKLNYSKTDIDWREYGYKALELLNKYQKTYYVKNDLAKYLGDYAYCNTDTRTIQEGDPPANLAKKPSEE